MQLQQQQNSSIFCHKFLNLLRYWLHKSANLTQARRFLFMAAQVQSGYANLQISLWLWCRDCLCCCTQKTGQTLSLNLPVSSWFGAMDYGLNALAAACSSTSLVKSAGNPQPLNCGLHHRRMTAELAIISEARTSCITACSTCKQAVCGRCASLTTVVVYYYQRVSHSANASNIFPEGVASKLL